MPCLAIRILGCCLVLQVLYIIPLPLYCFSLVDFDYSTIYIYFFYLLVYRFCWGVVFFFAVRLVFVIILIPPSALVE